MIPSTYKHRPPAMRMARPMEAPDAPVPVPMGVTIASLKPAGSVVCVLNGVALPRLTHRQRLHHARLLSKDLQAAQAYFAKAARRALNWEHVRTRPGDVIEWHEQQGDKETFRTVLQIATVVISIWFPALLPYALAANLAYNLLVPPSGPQIQPPEEAGRAIFNTSLNGNQARLDQPIWRNFGRVKITPPFAAMPYYEYIDDDDDDLDNQQRYHAVFAVGYDDHELEGAFIGRTPIESFQDVLKAVYLPPGTAPSIALCNVVTSSEVTQLELETGKYVGGYVACQPRRRAGSIGIDVMCPQGLGKSGNLTVSFRVEVRTINDFGTPTEAWRVVGNESHTANTNTPQRWSHKYFIGTVVISAFDGAFSAVEGTGYRVEVRVVRTDTKDTDSTARHSLQWIGLRAYLDEPATLNENVAHYEVVMRASEQLSAQSQRDFSLIVWPLVRTWHPDTGWGAKVTTRNPAWALADLWSDALWGEGLADSRIDLQGLYDWSVTLDERQDHFDYTFSTAKSAWDYSQMIARAGRARCFRRYGVKTIARDEWQELPMTALTPRNTIPDSMVVNERLPVTESPDGIIVEYTNYITWDRDFIECPCPGFTVTDPADSRFDSDLTPMSNPVYKTYEGIVGPTHAEREGLYDAADMVYRKRVVSCTTEMQGVITNFMMPVLWQPDIAGYGQSGDVAFWDEATLVMGLTEKPDFGTSGSTYLTLIRDDGSLTTAVLVTPGPTEWDVTLPAIPDFDLVLDSGTRERPKFILGDLDLLIKVSGITDGGKSEAVDGADGAQLYEIAGVVDDERVHTADNHLLPGPGDIQDPIDIGEGVGNDEETLALVTLKDHTLADGAVLEGGGISVTFTLRNNGTASYVLELNNGGSTVEIPAEWLLVPVETTQADNFEVYASTDAYPGSLFSGTLNSWTSLATNQSWVNAGAYDRTTIPLRLQIREVATGIVQCDRIIYMTVYVADISE